MFAQASSITWPSHARLRASATAQREVQMPLRASPPCESSRHLSTSLTLLDFTPSRNLQATLQGPKPLACRTPNKCLAAAQAAQAVTSTFKTPEAGATRRDREQPQGLGQTTRQLTPARRTCLLRLCTPSDCISLRPFARWLVEPLHLAG